MTTNYFVGETPSRPLVIVLKKADGTVYDLTDYSDVTLVGDGLPAGSTIVTDALNGRIQYSFSAPFTSAGVLDLRVELRTVDGDVDYASPMQVTVANESPGATLYATASDVEAITGTPVSNNKIARAQSMVSLACGYDLTDTTRTFSSRDTSLLRQAVAWQAEALQAGRINEELPAGASSISLGDAAVSFGPGGSGSHPWLSSLARAAILRLSWMGPRTLHPSTRTTTSVNRDRLLWNRIN